MFEGWKYYTNHLSHYNGRIWLVWKEEVYNITIISENAQAITCKVNHLLLKVEFIATFVYAYNQKEERKAL